MAAPIQSNEAGARIDDRRVRVADLMLNGYSERAIGARLGVSVGTVHSDIVAIRRDWRDDRSKTYDWHVAEMEARLKQLERVVARQIAKGDLAAVGLGLKVLERRARLLGLDAPARHDVRVEDPITAEIRTLAEKLGVLDDPAVRQALGPSIS